MLGQQEQMATIGRLTSSVVHEINNPLEAVLNLVFLARRSATLGEANGHLKRAEEELCRVSEITSQGLHFLGGQAKAAIRGHLKSGHREKP
jgi:two-component system, sporulation sensor kinase C